MHTLSPRVRSTALACAAGVVLAMTYTLSPMTVWFAAAMTMIFVYASHGLAGRERSWVLGLLSLGVAARVLVLITIFFVTYRIDSSFAVMIPDEGYIVRRAMWLRNIALDIPIAPADFIDAFNPFAESGVLYILAFLQLLIGPAPYGIRLLSVALCLAAAAILYRMVRPTFGCPASLLGLALLLFWPSAFVWSISVLKEPPYYFLSAVSLASIVAAVRARSLIARLMAVVTCVGALIAVATVRSAAAIVCGGGMGMGMALAILARRPVLRATAVILCVVAGGYALSNARVQQRSMQFLQNTAVIHIGHVKTSGRAYKLLDPKFYTRQDRLGVNYTAAARSMTGGEIARYVIRAALSFVLVPLPGQVSSRPAIVYLPQQVIWSVLVVFALVGGFVGLRRDALVTLVLGSTIVIVAAGVTLTSGNIGTFVRHRDMAMLLMAWLSGLGAVSAVQYVVARRRIRTSEPVGG